MNKSMPGYVWQDELQTERSWTVPERARPSIQATPASSPTSRSQPSQRDQTLSFLVPRWVDSLPKEAKPRHLCERYPRVANRLAMCWPDVKLTVGLFDELFVDKRGGRRGFPPEALRELRALREIAIDRINRPHD